MVLVQLGKHLLFQMATGGFLDRAPFGRDGFLLRLAFFACATLFSFLGDVLDLRAINAHLGFSRLCVWIH